MFSNESLAWQIKASIKNQKQKQTITPILEKTQCIMCIDPDMY